MQGSLHLVQTDHGSIASVGSASYPNRQHPCPPPQPMRSVDARHCYSQILFALRCKPRDKSCSHRKMTRSACFCLIHQSILCAACGCKQHSQDSCIDHVLHAKTSLLASPFSPTRIPRSNERSTEYFLSTRDGPANPCCKLTWMLRAKGSAQPECRSRESY